jgi:hypothetical protein
MKVTKVLQWSSVLCLSVLAVQAQETNQTEKVLQQFKVLKDKFDRQQQELLEQRQQIDALTKKLEALTKEKSAETDKQKLEQQLAAELQQNQPPAAPTAQPSTPAAWSASAPLTIARAGSAYMNISFDALMDAGWSTADDPSAFLQLGDHDPIKRGFSLRNAEIALDGAVDPYFKGFANIVFKLDKNNETGIELEETYLQSTSLPENLQLKAGQFFANFGRQNLQHPHQWAFVDAPIILTRAFGPEGLRSIGGQLSWLAPTPFFTEASLGIFDGQGGTAFGFRNPGEDDGTGTRRFHGRATLDSNLRGPGDLVYVPRVASSFELNESQTLVVGASAAFGANETGSANHTQIYGADVYWKWKPANAHAGFPFLAWQTEVLFERFAAGEDLEAGLPSETLEDYGFYSQLLWGFSPRWVAALRGDWASGNKGAFDAQDIYRGERTRVSPNLTFYPSEFSKFRLQYNYDHGQHFGEEHSIWLQVEFLLGAHGAHKF